MPTAQQLTLVGSLTEAKALYTARTLADYQLGYQLGLQESNGENNNTSYTFPVTYTNGPPAVEATIAELLDSDNIKSMNSITLYAFGTGQQYGITYANNYNHTIQIELPTDTSTITTTLNKLITSTDPNGLNKQCLAAFNKGVTKGSTSKEAELFQINVPAAYTEDITTSLNMLKGDNTVLYSLNSLTNRASVNGYTNGVDIGKGLGRTEKAAEIFEIFVYALNQTITTSLNTLKEAVGVPNSLQKLTADAADTGFGNGLAVGSDQGRTEKAAELFNITLPALTYPTIQTSLNKLKAGEEESYSLISLTNMAKNLGSSSGYNNGYVAATNLYDRKSGCGFILNATTWHWGGNILRTPSQPNATRLDNAENSVTLAYDQNSNIFNNQVFQCTFRRPKYFTQYFQIEVEMNFFATVGGVSTTLHPFVGSLSYQTISAGTVLTLPGGFLPTGMIHYVPFQPNATSSARYFCQNLLKVTYDSTAPEFITLKISVNNTNNYSYPSTNTGVFRFNMLELANII